MPSITVQSRSQRLAHGRYETDAEDDRGLLRTVAPGSRMHKAILVRTLRPLKTALTAGELAASRFYAADPMPERR